jgi:hypothetical protein
MLFQYQSFNPELIIVDHFDEIINQIYIKKESVLDDQSLPEEARNKIYELRENQI